MPEPLLNDELVEIQTKTVIELSPAVTFAEVLREAIFRQPGAESYPEIAEALYAALISHPELDAMLQGFPGEISIADLANKVEELIPQLVGESIATILGDVDLAGGRNPREFIEAVYTAIAPLWPEDEREVLWDKLWLDPNIQNARNTYDFTLKTDAAVEREAWRNFTNQVVDTILGDPTGKFMPPPFGAIASEFNYSQFGADMETVVALATWRPVVEAQAIEKLRKNLDTLKKRRVRIGHHNIPVPLTEHFEQFLVEMETRQSLLLDLWVEFFSIEDEGDDWFDKLQDNIARGLIPFEFLLGEGVDFVVWEYDQLASVADFAGWPAGADFLREFPRESISWLLSQGIAVAQLGIDVEAAFRSDPWSTIAGIALGMGVNVEFMLLDILALANDFVEGSTAILSPVVGLEPLDLPLDELVSEARNTVRDRSAGFIGSIGGDSEAFKAGFNAGHFAMGVAETFVAVATPKGGGIDTNLGKLPVGIKNINTTQFLPGAEAAMSFAPAVELSYVIVTPRRVLTAALMSGSGTGPTPPEDNGTEGGDRTSDDIVPAHDLSDFLVDPDTPGLVPQPGGRRTGVNRAWRQERELVERTGSGTRDWTASEIEELLETGKVTGYVGDHINGVKSAPSWQGDPRNIQFVPESAHLGEHGGNWRNPDKTGPLIDRQEMIDTLGDSQ